MLRTVAAFGLAVLIATPVSAESRDKDETRALAKLEQRVENAERDVGDCKSKAEDLSRIETRLKAEMKADCERLTDRQRGEFGALVKDFEKDLDSVRACAGIARRGGRFSVARDSQLG